MPAVPGLLLDPVSAAVGIGVGVLVGLLLRLMPSQQR